MVALWQACVSSSEEEEMALFLAAEKSFPAEALIELMVWGVDCLKVPTLYFVLENGLSPVRCQ